ncbi:hypothetical protein GTA08_BOTSDO09334 [Botryosphaeria dothidea]|uniref:Uncharacterized protein n=1 Tax=Botryosphaeria dothidea TaxID=55169 RepID=A0A8H4N4Z3_9PEZI|nr:hypothetical protein GTA08_BOTSDO09334 [Botryosphaeria dothidea]
MKEYNRKARALHSGPSNTDQKDDVEDHLRDTEIAFKYTVKRFMRRSKTKDYIAEERAFFDKGFKIKCQKGSSYNFISQRVLDKLPVKPSNVVMFDKPTTEHKIKVIDGRLLEVLGHCHLRWWVIDKDCRDKEIWADFNFMESEFLIISREALYPILITWNTMSEEGLLKPTTGAAAGQGGFHPQPPLSNEEERKRKKALQQAIQTKERAEQDKAEKKRK